MASKVAKASGGFMNVLSWTALARMSFLTPWNSWLATYLLVSISSPGLIGLREPLPRDRTPTC